MAGERKVSGTTARTEASLISVVIPHHNRAALVQKAVSSVLRQTYERFEVIVVDDGSQDSSAGRFEGVSDPRIRCVRQERSGANRARNRGIDAARGDFVAFLDSDDRFMPRHLERTADALAADPGALVFSRVLVDRGGGARVIKPPRSPRPGESIGEYLFCDRGFVPTSTVALSTELARTVRYLDGLRSGQDADFAIRVAAAGVRLRMVDAVGAICDDRADPSRVSSNVRLGTVLRWLADTKPLLTERAYYGCRGWVAAKAAAQAGRRRYALGLYASAVARGCYEPAFALRVLAQIMLGQGGYRRAADAAIRLGAK